LKSSEHGYGANSTSIFSSAKAEMLKEKVYHTWLHRHYVLHAQIQPKSLRVKNRMNSACGLRTSSRVRLTHLAQLAQLARQTQHAYQTQLAQLAQLPRRPSTPSSGTPDAAGTAGTAPTAAEHPKPCIILGVSESLLFRLFSRSHAHTHSLAYTLGYTHSLGG